MRLHVELPDEFARQIAQHILEEAPALQGPLVLTPEQAAEALGGDYSREAIVALCRDGELEFYRKSDASKSPYLIPRDALDAYVRAQVDRFARRV